MPAPAPFIDLHTHVLPGLDDGPATMEDALALARMVVASGTGTVVATPHVDHIYTRNDAERVFAAGDEMRAALAAEGIPLEVRTGAEVALTRATELPTAELRRLTLGGGPSLLIECPATPTAAGFEVAIDRILREGFRVVLAHVERIPGFREQPEALRRLVERGVVTQVSAASFTGGFGRRAQASAKELLTEGLVGVVASDTHSAARDPELSAHLHAAGLDDAAIDVLVREAPLAVLQGAALPHAPRTTSGRFSRRRPLVGAFGRRS